ncbi:MAG: glycerophosphodiester phosphodiesterase [Spirosoma sp.]|uniref:glycerophosphodiester phosphodiesterase n=2 Tax=unclassified Spirosoma TaxID=2621999 RepID=UPI000967B5E7|nr:glycerophosphodiester phosphodiesterase family protein [Spirosoma sp. 48-14]MBN8821164.1 glycerophosphodiester phosphodiesterase [Spirosoma sp.]OJW79205.1 MAG: glycerophosphodiester phosphodiesterase [Spirosoma sp. 48-14]
MNLSGKAAFLLVVMSTAGMLSGMAQSVFSLNNYTYTPSQLTIGALQAQEPIKRLSLKGPNAKLFSLDKANLLSIKTEAANADRPWYDVVVEGVGAKGTVRDTFRVVKDTFIRNQVIAHRGAWKQAGTTENSLTSLQNAIKLGCMGSEFDVHMSSDSVLFVNHDHTIQGIEIEKTPATELEKVKLSNGESLPTLAAYLSEGMKQTKTKLILEIKTSRLGKERSLALTERVVKMVHQMKAQAWVDYIAFDYDVCKKVKALTPEAKVSYLMGDKTPEQLAADHLDGFDYHQNVVRKNEAWIQDARQRKLTTNVWTVNDKADLSWLLGQQVDFITTNEPELLLSMIQK